MGKHLREPEIEQIVELLQDWPKEVKLTYDALEAAIETNFGYTTTSVTLKNKARIKSQYEATKKALKGASKETPKKSLPPNLKAAQERIEKLERSVKVLEEENAKLHEQFITWQYNATRNKVTIEQLNMPLPDHERE